MSLAWVRVTLWSRCRHSEPQEPPCAPDLAYAQLILGAAGTNIHNSIIVEASPGARWALEQPAKRVIEYYQAHGGVVE